MGGFDYLTTFFLTKIIKIHTMQTSINTITYYKQLHTINAMQGLHRVAMAYVISFLNFQMI